MQGVYHFRTKNEQQAKQFELSILTMANNSVWAKENRFKSFAPIRCNAAVAWFVDGRDYFWDVSVALENAKETIYIHDWWLVKYTLFFFLISFILKYTKLFFFDSHLSW